MQNKPSSNQARHLLMSIVPSLIALVAFLLPLPQAFTLLIIMFLAQCVLDFMATDSGELAEWYAPHFMHGVAHLAQFDPLMGLIYFK